MTDAATVEATTSHDPADIRRHALRPLSDMEAAFARAYVVSHSPTRAAQAAGYSPGSQAAAKTAGYRLLKRRHVQAEIARLEYQAGRTVNGLMPAGDPPVIAWALPPPVSPPTAEQLKADAEIAAALAKSYVVAGLIENYEYALGRRPRKITKVVQKRRKGGKGGVDYVTHELMVYDPNPQAAVATAVVLLRETGNELPPGDEAQGGHFLDEAVERFIQSRSKRA